MTDLSTSREDLIDRISNLVEKEGMPVPVSVLDRAARLVELLSMGLKAALTVKPLPEGGIRVEVDGLIIRAELDLYKEKRTELRFYRKNSDEMIARFEGEILV